jgi:hypothetical protein
MNPNPPGLGHNAGPPLDDEHVPEWGPGPIGSYFEWKRAHRRAWRRAPRSVVMFRLDRAERVGLTYHEYTAEILDRGRYLQVEDISRISEIKAARGPAVRASRPPADPPITAAPDTGPQAPALRRLRRVR